MGQAHKRSNSLYECAEGNPAAAAAAGSCHCVRLLAVGGCMGERDISFPKLHAANTVPFHEPM
jgi:hypothetical protein